MIYEIRFRLVADEDQEALDTFALLLEACPTDKEISMSNVFKVEEPTGV